jgi:putative glutamine amidotransferase
MKLIAVTPCFLYPDPDRAYFSPKQLDYIENDMVNYVYRAGGLPVFLPDLIDSGWKKLLQKCDGLVMQGGSDVCPESYGEPYLNKEKWPGDKYRDEIELDMVREALALKIPILGICRGAQLLNAYFGGTLYQDMASENAQFIEHRNAKAYDTIKHQLVLEAGGKLEKIYSDEEDLWVNTVHHQGIKSLGKDLRVEAISPKDDLVEAFSYNGSEKHWVLGVQWHPEFSPTLDGQILCEKKLIAAFMQATDEVSKC